MLASDFVLDDETMASIIEAAHEAYEQEGHHPPPRDDNEEEPQAKRKRVEVDRSMIECPICQLDFCGKVYQCTEGHVICEECRARLEGLSGCPTCRGSLSGNIRNRCLEELASKYDTTCGNKGCNWAGKVSQSKEHRMQCEHRLYECPFFMNKNLMNTPCTWKGHLCDAKDHLIKSHNFREKKADKENKISMYFTNPKSLGNSSWCILTVLPNGDLALVTCNFCRVVWGEYRVCAGILGKSTTKKYKMTVEGHGIRMEREAPMNNTHVGSMVRDAHRGHCLSIKEKDLMTMSTGYDNDTPDKMKVLFTMNIIGN